MENETRRPKRSEQIMVRLSPEIKEQFQHYSEKRGFSMSAMAAYLVSEFIREEESRQRPDT